MVLEAGLDVKSRLRSFVIVKEKDEGLDCNLYRRKNRIILCNRINRTESVLIGFIKNKVK